MRIIGGSAKGRRLVGPRGTGTRPLIGRAREALFSRLGDRLPEARVLDLYAGSGALGLEALSRGARSVVFVERGRQALGALRRNVAAVGLGGTIVDQPVERFLSSERGTYDIVFVDPPKALTDGEAAAEPGAVAGGVEASGVVIVHRRAGSALELGAGSMLMIQDARRYGDAEVWWLDKEIP